MIVSNNAKICSKIRKAKTSKLILKIKAIIICFIFIYLTTVRYNPFLWTENNYSKSINIETKQNNKRDGTIE